jgi:serine/threonine protein kinase
MLTAERVKQNYAKWRYLGEGADGRVEVWRDRKDWQKIIAIKYPVQHNTQEAAAREIAMLKTLQDVRMHHNVLHMLGYGSSWMPLGPVLFAEVAELGDLVTYRSAQPFFPEVTMWKCFADLIKGLHFLHTELDVPVMHGDFKPNNVLVMRPVECNDDIPLLPTFKIADFARAVRLTPKELNDWKYIGTPEYAPPISEQHRASVAIDIFSLGCTVQFMAFYRVPCLDEKFFIQQHPEYQDHDHEQLRYVLPFKLRRLDASYEEQVGQFDVEPERASPEGYSETLNIFYEMCVDFDPAYRATSHDLMEAVVPVAASQVRMYLAEQARRKAEFKAQFAYEPGMEDAKERTGFPGVGQKLPPLKIFPEVAARKVPPPPPLPPRPQHQRWHRGQVLRTESDLNHVPGLDLLPIPKKELGLRKLALVNKIQEAAEKDM